VTAVQRSTVTGIVILVPEATHLAPYAHVTLLAPFGRDGGPTVEEIGEVERFFADVTPFDFTLDGESTFPGGLRYLCPEPAITFSRLTHRLHRLFPEYPPYGGAYDLVVPHLTIPADAPAAGAPLRARAHEAVLLHGDLEEATYSVLARFPFGTSAA
jgi:hypothetical protein